MGTPNIPTKTDKSLVYQSFAKITHKPKVVSSSLIVEIKELTKIYFLELGTVLKFFMYLIVYFSILSYIEIEKNGTNLSTFLYVSKVVFVNRTMSNFLID